MNFLTKRSPYSFDDYRKLLKKNDDFKIQLSIIKIEECYRKIEDLGGFEYNLILNKDQERKRYMRPYFNKGVKAANREIILYKNSGAEKSNEEYKRDMDTALSNFPLYLEKDDGLNIFKNCKRKERFQKYREITKKYDIESFNRVIDFFEKNKSSNFPVYNKNINENIIAGIKLPEFIRDSSHYYEITDYKDEIANMLDEIKMQKERDILNALLMEIMVLLEKDYVEEIKINAELEIIEDVILSQNMEFIIVGGKDIDYKGVNPSINSVNEFELFLMFTRCSFKKGTWKKSVRDFLSNGTRSITWEDKEEYIKELELFINIEKERKIVMDSISEIPEPVNTNNVKKRL